MHPYDLVLQQVHASNLNPVPFILNDFRRIDRQIED